MDWQLVDRPLILAAYGVNLAIRARRALVGPRRHRGDAANIISACIDDCWNGHCYTASPGYFHQFWTRDLCFSAVAIARRSDQDRGRVLASLSWAIRAWRRRRSHITTTIHYFSQPVDVFDYGVDCLPLLLTALLALEGQRIVERHRTWLQREVEHYVDEVVDPDLGLVRTDRKFSAHRDTVVNRCNAYGNSMVALLADTAPRLGLRLPDPLRPIARDPAGLLTEVFWNEAGGYFVDRPGDTAPSGEGNLWPYWTGVVTDQARMRSSLATLAKAGFATPYPLRYEVTRDPAEEPLFVRTFMPNYQGTTAWTSLGSIYLQLLHHVDPESAREGIERYVAWIERDGTFWEVLDGDTGRPYRSSFLTQSDESMLWSAIFLDLIRHPDLPPAILSAP